MSEGSLADISSHWESLNKIPEVKDKWETRLNCKDERPAMVDEEIMKEAIRYNWVGIEKSLES